MRENSGAVRFLYGNVVGRALLSLILHSHADRLAVAFLSSPLSRPLARWQAKRLGIPPEQAKGFDSYQAFFARTRTVQGVDLTPGRLISPCDGYLSVYPIQADSSFVIKGSHYRLSDLLQDDTLSQSFHGGDCLIFRLCPTHYHHYHYIDDAYQGEHHFLPGQLHSVQPIACETYPVYVRNRRCWSLLTTDHFGPVVQVEIGALIVGGICNECQNCRVRKGAEKGHFELAGSTIVLLLQKGQLRLRPALLAQLEQGREVPVELGMYLGDAAASSLQKAK